jgi:glycosyltransferase involved in cell wall biosynthesis
MNILFLTTVLPGEKCTGGEIVSQQLIDSLTQHGHRVTVLGYKPRERIYTEKSNEIAIGSRYIETETAKYYPWIWILSSYLRGLPYSAQKYYSKAYLAKVTELLAREHYDIVTIDHAQLGWLQAVDLGTQTKQIFVSHNIEHDVYLEQMHRATNPILKQLYQRESKLIKVMEDRLAATAARVWTLTAHDAAYFAKVTNRVSVFNIPADRAGLPDFPEQKPSQRVSDTSCCELRLLGTWTWQPNKEGLQWFFQHVYPHLPTTLAIQVAGKGADWLSDRYPNVKYCGFVPDARAFIAQAKAIAIPTLGGGGIQIKTLEAIASGASIVATPTALRGIADYPRSVSVASEPRDFANRAIELVSNPPLAQQRQEAIDWSRRRWEAFCLDVGAAF